MSDVLVKFEDEAMEWLKELQAYRTYQGTNPEYRAKAKTAVGVIGAYVRLRATMANEKQIRLIERRLDGDVLTEDVRALPESIPAAAKAS